MWKVGFFGAMAVLAGRPPNLCCCVVALSAISCRLSTSAAHLSARATCCSLPRMGSRPGSSRTFISPKARAASRTRSSIDILRAPMTPWSWSLVTSVCQMEDELKQLLRRYAAVFRRYLANAEEAVLEESYALGRWAVSRGLGVLKVARVHHQVLGECLP